VRYLPPPSPDLNLVELALAKLKAYFRQAADRARNDLPPDLAQSRKTFSPAHGQGFFHHKQYGTI
jgi:transposase